MVKHQIKYPLGQEVSKNLRPFLSRYGRFIIFSDNRTFLLQDRGSHIKGLLKIIEQFDNEAIFQNYLARKEEEALQESRKSLPQKKIEALEKEIKALKRENKKYKRKANTKKGA